MKKKSKFWALTLCATSLLSMPLVLTSCGGDKEDTSKEDDTKVTSFSVYLSSTSKTVTSITGYEGEEDTLVPQINAPESGSSTFQYDTSDADVVDVSNTGTIVYKKEGSATVKVTALNSDDGEGNKVSVSLSVTVNPKRYMTGAASYAASGYEDKLEILGKLEKYAIDNHLTGITLFESGGKAVYSSRVNFPTTNYITGYGFGIQSDGSLNGLLSGINESYYTENPEWAYYYQGAASTGVKNICYLDDSGSVSADLYGYISCGLYGTQINESGTGYKWVPILAKGDPVPCHVDENMDYESDYTDDEISNSSGLFSSFKIEVKTGSDGVKYSTLSTKSEVSKFDNQEVELEDYVTAYRNLLTKRNNYYRGAEMTSLTSSGTLKGALSYYNSTGNGTKEEEDEKKFESTVGLKTYTDSDNRTYLIFTLNSPLSIFYAKYNLGGNLTMPVPQSFLDYVTPSCYGKGDSTRNIGVKDSILSLGAYNIEKFTTKASGDSDEFVFKVNPNYQVLEPGKYKNIPGVHLTSYDTGSDADILVKEFKNGRLDGCSLTKNTLNDSFPNGQIKTVEGSSTFKLNINSCTEEEWISLFGENGTIAQQSKSAYWDVKPFMSNKNFLNGLSFCIDRETFAANRGMNPSQDYFAPAYLWDPEGDVASELGISASYDQTSVHKNNLTNYFPETYGYNVEAAKRSFRSAINELVNSGQIKLPYSGTLDIMWMNTGDTKEYGEDIEKNIEEVVNSVNSDFQIDVVNHDGTSDYQDVYNKMKQGQFDLGFGSISGMTLDPLGFLEVLKSDNSSGFTLNWGQDTSKPTGEIIYQDKAWSFDSLWQAANKGAVIDDDGIVVTNPVTVVSGQTKHKTYGQYELYTVLVELVNATGADIELQEKGNIGTITYYDKTDGTTTGTSSTYSFMFDEIEDGYKISDSTGSDSTKTYKQITLKVPSSFETTFLDESTGTVSSSDYYSISLTCSYNLGMYSIKDGEQVYVQTSSSFEIDL